MNYLYAKLAGRGDVIQNLSSAIPTIYTLPHLTDANTFDYNSQYKLEEDEWFKLENFSEKKYKNIFIDSPSVNTAEHSNLSENDAAKIEYLCAGQERYFFFQRVIKGQIAMKKFYSFSSRHLIEDTYLTINQCPDAVYCMDKDVLYFKELDNIKHIFKNIEDLYREATQQEVANFFSESHISCVNGYDEITVKSANRKRIALFQGTMRKNNITANKLASYLRKYHPEIPYKNNTFQISSEKELKQLLFAIDERYYTSTYSNEKRCANSIIQIT